MAQQAQQPRNINDYDDFVASGLVPGDKVHLGVVGNHVSDEAVLRGIIEDDERPDVVRGVKVELQGQVIDLAWGDIVEFWKLP